MTRTTDFGLQYGAKFSKQLDTTPADLYGGANSQVPGANDLMKFDELKLTDTPEQFQDVSTNGTQFETGQLVSATPVQFQGTIKAYTHGIERLLVSALGYERLDGPVENAGKFCRLICLAPNGKDQRTYTAAEAALVVGYDADDRINTYLNFAVTKGPSDELAKNGSIKSFTIKAESKGPLMLEIAGSAERLTRDATKAASAALTLASGTQQSYYMLRDFRDPSTGASLIKMGPAGSMTALSALSMSVSVELGQADGQYPTGTSNGGLSQAEPVATGPSTITVEIKRYLQNNDTFKTWEQVGTEVAFSAEAAKGDDGLAICVQRLQVTAVELDEADGGSITITAKGYLLSATSEAFTAIRTFNSAIIDLPFNTGMFLKVVSPNAVNQLRSV